MGKLYHLLDSQNRPYDDSQKGRFGGHKGSKIYGRLDCASAQRWIAKGHYLHQRVFFKDEATARAAGYRPCATCMPAAYKAWKAAGNGLS